MPLPVPDQQVSKDANTTAAGQRIGPRNSDTSTAATQCAFIVLPLGQAVPGGYCGKKLLCLPRGVLAAAAAFTPME